jgi:diadenosine tetraphosphate (Ap4A) HIT family hydrolase
MKSTQAPRPAVPPPCPFCQPHEALARNALSYMIYDRHPASPGHILVVTKRHCETLFDCSDEERVAMLQLVGEAKALLDETHSPDGYNIGINVGEAAGQTVMHCHIHVIPRYAGDVPNPRGGVRAVIPGNQSY